MLLFLVLLFVKKTRLGNPEVRKVVDQSIQEYLTEYLELHPNVLDSILSKALNAFKVDISNICFFEIKICFIDPSSLERISVFVIILFYSLIISHVTLIPK